jgi:hypothetical protein
MSTLSSLDNRLKDPCSNADLFFSRRTEYRGLALLPGPFWEVAFVTVKVKRWNLVVIIETTFWALRTQNKSLSHPVQVPAVS